MTKEEARIEKKVVLLTLQKANFSTFWVLKLTFQKNFLLRFSWFCFGKMECFASFSLSNNMYGCNLLSYLLAHDKSVSGEPIYKKKDNNIQLQKSNTAKVFIELTWYIKWTVFMLNVTCTWALQNLIPILRQTNKYKLNV